MAYSLLDATNLILKRAKIISGVNGALTSLTDSARQTYIDVAVQVINEVVHEIYSESSLPQPKGSATENITLATDTREYSLPSDLEQIRYPLQDETNGKYIYEYPGGFEQMRKDQNIPGNYKGIPFFACINPTNDKLRMNVQPTSAENGLVYVCLYDKRLALSLAADTFPFSDTVVDALVPVWTQDWNRSQKRSFDADERTREFGIAVRYLNQTPMRRKW